MDDALLKKATRYLKKSDGVLANIINECDPINLNKSNPPHYHALVSAIINQQLSVKAASTIEKRLLTLNGGRYFNAGTILKLKPAEIRNCGLSHKKVHYVRSLAIAIRDGELNFRKIAKQNDAEVHRNLTKYPGIGPWSADIFMISSLRRPDILPIGDLIIRKAMQRYYPKLLDDSKIEQYVHVAESWRPYRTIASFYLWKSYHMV